MSASASARKEPQQLFMFPRAPIVPVPPIEIHGDASISACGQYRWWLKRWWSAGPYVCWVMLNPSTADAERDDPTLRQVIHFTRFWGYSGLVVVNLFPIRTPDQKACRRWADMAKGPDDWSIAASNALFENRKVIAEQTAGADLIVAAWGAGGWYMPAALHAHGAMLQDKRLPGLHCLGFTESGAPKHPLARGVHRVPRNQQPVAYRLAAEADA
jgi:hypothetical protein